MPRPPGRAASARNPPTPHRPIRPAARPRRASSPGARTLGATDLDRCVAIAEAAADAAGRVIRPLFRSRLLATDIKPDETPVTRADREAEAAIRAVIAARAPDHAVSGEESGDSGMAAARFRWVIDPIDGTRAFITGRPTFGTLIGLLDGGRPIVGVIDQPVTGERWVGAAGAVTRFRGPLGGHAGTRRCPALGGAELSATSPAMFDGEARASFDRLAAAVARVSWGGDCYAYGLLALGTIDLVVEASMKAWDWTALVPVVEGAGGAVTDWQGRPPSQDGDGRVLAAGDPGLVREAVRTLRAR